MIDYSHVQNISLLTLYFSHIFIVPYLHLLDNAAHFHACFAVSISQGMLPLFLTWGVITRQFFFLNFSFLAIICLNSYNTYFDGVYHCFEWCGLFQLLKNFTHGHTLDCNTGDPYRIMTQTYQSPTNIRSNGWFVFDMRK